MKINDNLRELRISRSLTQEQVAEKLNVTRQTISSYESGRTRPDIDTLVKFSEVYGVELESLIYGADKELKVNRRIKLVAKILFVLLVAFVILGSISYLSANVYFPLVDSFQGEPPFEWQAHWNLVKVWQVLDSCVSTVSFLGFAFLFVMLIMGKVKIHTKTKLIYLGLLSALLLIIPTVCGLADPKFSPQEYILTEGFVVTSLWILLGVEEIVLYFKNQKK